MNDNPRDDLGSARVRASFNPSGDQVVTKLKEAGASLINLLEELKDQSSPSEKNRCLALAQTNIETGIMYAVKGATSP